MSVSIVMSRMIIIFVLIFTGFLMTKLKITDMNGSRQISAIVSNITNPALLLASAFTATSAITNEDVLFVILVSMGLFFLWFLLGLVMGPVLRAEKDDWDYYRLMTMFGNCGFIGIPLVTALIGPEYVIYVAIYNLFFNLLIYSYGTFLLSRHCSEKRKLSWKTFVNPGTIASVLTLLIFWFKIPVPAIAADAITFMGDATIFLALFIVGISLAQVSVKDIFGDVHLYFFILLRLILVPILMAFVLGLFMPDESMHATMVIMCAVPVGNLSLMLARERNLDAAVLSRGIILSTLLSIVTIPIVTLFV